MCARTSPQLTCAARAAALVQHLSPSLGVELTERAYGDDCRPVYGNIRRAPMPRRREVPQR